MSSRLIYEHFWHYYVHKICSYRCQSIACYFELDRCDTKTHTERTKSSTLSWPVFVLVPKATGGKSFATQSRKHSVLCSHQFCHTVWKGCENDPQLALTMKPNDVLTTNVVFFILWEGKDIKQGYEPGRNKQVKSAGLKKWVQWVHHHKQHNNYILVNKSHDDYSDPPWNGNDLKEPMSMTMEGSEREDGRMNIKTINCFFILFR